LDQSAGYHTTGGLAAKEVPDPGASTLTGKETVSPDKIVLEAPVRSVPNTWSAYNQPPPIPATDM